MFIDFCIYIYYISWYDIDLAEGFIFNWKLYVLNDLYIVATSQADTYTSATCGTLADHGVGVASGIMNAF